jgi:hypothetical protein
VLIGHHLGRDRVEAAPRFLASGRWGIST